MSVEDHFAEYQRVAALWWESVGRHWPFDALARYGWGGRCILTGNDERVGARVHLAAGELLHHDDGNPLRAWAAVLDARRAGVALPEWVLTYLARSAGRLLEIAHEDVDRERRPGRVAEALGLTPKGAGRKRDAFDRWRDPLPALTLAMDYWKARAKLTHDDALEQVMVTHGVSASTVKQAWTRWRDLVTPAHLRRQRQ